MKFTNELNGADVERLADCIKYASKHGLSIGENTQCGVNTSSGNVWLWDEDWQGCVYCSIGFNTAYIMTCSYCGFEDDVEFGEVFTCECDDFKKDYPEGIEIN
jgi:hypothetical protein